MKAIGRLVIVLLGLAVMGVSSKSPAAERSGLLLVANKGDRTLSIIDPVTYEQLAAVAEDGVTGHEVVASADGKRAFVPIYGSGGVGGAGTDGHLIRVVDLEKHAITGTVDLGKGLRPHCAVIGPKNHMLYVTTELSDSITLIEPDTLKVLGTIPTGQPESHMLAITSDGRRGYTSNVGPGTVSALDLEARKVVTVIPVSPKAQRICLSPDDRWVFTADQSKPRVAVIDTATNAVTKWIPLPGRGYGMAATPDGRCLIVALIGLNQVGSVDLDTMKVTRTLDVPKAPQEVLVRPDGAVAYVSCDASSQVAAIDLKNWKVEKLIPAGHGADGLAWAAGR